MKRYAISGAITALGCFLSVAAACKHPSLDWTEVALIVGIALISAGVVRIGDEL